MLTQWARRACFVVAVLLSASVFAQSPALFLGNPSNAKSDGSDHNNYLMLKQTFAISYNNSKGEPNWVSWRLTKDDLGDAPRKKSFATDLTLPKGFTRITSHDYADAGFDRGHMCPHGDRTHDLDMSYSTFIMTNIIPQAPNVNEKAWDILEQYCRELVNQQHDRLYIIDGPAGQGGTGTRGEKDTLANGKVVVPAVCWKVVIIVPDEGKDDLSEITSSTRVLAVIVPNDNKVQYDWAQYRTSINAVEKLTGDHFLSNVRPAIAAVLKQKVDSGSIRLTGAPAKGHRESARAD